MPQCTYFYRVQFSDSTDGFRRKFYNIKCTLTFNYLVFCCMVIQNIINLHLKRDSVVIINLTHSSCLKSSMNPTKLKVFKTSHNDNMKEHIVQNIFMYSSVFFIYFDKRYIIIVLFK